MSGQIRTGRFTVLWSSSSTDGPNATAAADHWRYESGAPEPELVVHNPDRDSTLDVIAGDGDGRSAFVERNERLYGPNGWTVWLLPAPGAKPVLADRSDEASRGLEDTPANAFGWGGLLVHRLSTGQEFDIDPIEMHTGRPVVQQRVARRALRRGP